MGPVGVGVADVMEAADVVAVADPDAVPDEVLVTAVELSW